MQQAGRGAAGRKPISPPHPGYFVIGITTLKVTPRSGSKPFSTLFSRRKLRTASPAPVSSRRETPTSATMSALRSRWCLGPGVTIRLPISPAPSFPARAVCSAGAKPKTSAATQATAAVISRTYPSSPAPSRRGVAGAEDPDGFQGGLGDEEAGRQAEREEHRGLGQQLPGKARNPAAERPADCHLVPVGRWPGRAAGWSHSRRRSAARTRRRRGAAVGPDEHSRPSPRSRTPCGSWCVHCCPDTPAPGRHRSCGSASAVSGATPSRRRATTWR